MLRFEVGHTYKNLIDEQCSSITVTKRIPIPHTGEIRIYDDIDDNEYWIATCEKDVEIIKTWCDVYRADVEA